MKIRAVTLDAVGGPVRVETVDLDEPRCGEVLVRMGASGVCRSDQHAISGRHTPHLPCVLGHEGAGDVVAIGPDVDRVRVGMRVTLNWLPSCGRCFHCRRGEPHLCREVTCALWSGVMADGTSRLSRCGQPLLHYSGVSTWADHMVVAERCCVPIDPNVPHDVAAIIGCAVVTGVGAALRRGSVAPGDRVAVVGAGGVGLSVIMGAVLAGAEQVIAVDPCASKAALAEAVGATDFVLADQDAVERVRTLTGGRGADIAFEAVGDPRLQECWLDGIRPGGTLVLVGLPASDARTSFAGADLCRMEKTIMGSYFSAADPVRAIGDLCTAFVDGVLPIDRLVSRRVGIDHIQDALDAMLAGTEGRVVIAHR